MISIRNKGSKIPLEIRGLNSNKLKGNMFKFSIGNEIYVSSGMCVIPHIIGNSDTSLKSIEQLNSN